MARRPLAQISRRATASALAGKSAAVTAPGVVAQFGDDQPLPVEIDRHVIDASADMGERNLAFEPQGLGFFGAGRRRAEPAEQAEQDRSGAKPTSPKGFHPRHWETTPVLSKAARIPLAKARASSCAQKCMKKRRG